jgi:hypothetical protein
LKSSAAKERNSSEIHDAKGPGFDEQTETGAAYQPSGKSQHDDHHVVDELIEVNSDDEESTSSDMRAFSAMGAALWSFMLAVASSWG